MGRPRRAVLVMIALALPAASACNRKSSAERAPEATPLAPDGAASVVVAPPVPASALPRPSSSPAAQTEGPADTAVEQRSATWRARVFKRSFDPKRLEQLGVKLTVDAVHLETQRQGAFAVVVASFAQDPGDGTAGELQESLIVTRDGELELKGGAKVVGLADLDGDGRPDLVLGDVTAIADRATGPLELVVRDKGGAFGWSAVRIGTHDGKPALTATTETTSVQCIECARGGFGFSRTLVKGVIEEVTLAWNGKQLAAVARKPMETAAEAAARVTTSEAENQRQALQWEQQKREMAARQKEWEAQAAADAKQLAACTKACGPSCAGSEAGAGCLAACRARCDK